MRRILATQAGAPWGEPAWIRSRLTEATAQPLLGLHATFNSCWPMGSVMPRLRRSPWPPIRTQSGQRKTSSAHQALPNGAHGTLPPYRQI